MNLPISVVFMLDPSVTNLNGVSVLIAQTSSSADLTPLFAENKEDMDMVDIF